MVPALEFRDRELRHLTNSQMEQPTGKTAYPAAQPLVTGLSPFPSKLAIKLRRGEGEARMRKAGAEVSVSKNSLLLQSRLEKSIQRVKQWRGWGRGLALGGGGAWHPGDETRGQGNRLTQSHPYPEVLYQN